MTTLALVGIGRWGKNLLREFSKISIVKYVYSKGNETNIAHVNKEFPKIKVVKDYDSILDDKEVDAIVIATPIQTHYELAKKALEAGKHVFVEKPICESLDEARELAQIAKENDKTLMTGYTFLFHPAIRKLKEIVSDEEVMEINFLWNKFGSFDEDVIMNLGSHVISIADDILGEIVDSEVLFRLSAISDSDIISFKLIHKDRKHSRILINRISQDKSFTLIVKTNKNVYLWQDSKVSRLNSDKREYDIVYQTDKTPLEVECEEFIDSVIGGKKPYSDQDKSIKILEILLKLGGQ